MMITTINEFAKSIKPTNITIVYVRSSQNTYSSDDQTAHIVGKDLRKKLIYEYNAWCKEYTEENQEVNGKYYNFYCVTIAPKFSLRNENNFNKEKKIKIKQEIISLFNCKEGEPDVYKQFRKQESERYKINYEKERKEKEYVLHKFDYKEQTSKDYVGGFDLDIIFEEILISYIEKGLVFGYIGHSCRKIWVDQLLAKLLLPVMKKEDFAAWLTSSGGRHFGDSIEHLVETNDKQGVEQEIKRQLPYIHDQAIVYNHPEHGGTLGSSADIWDKLHNLDMTLCETNPFRISQQDLDNFGKNLGK